MSFGQRYLSNPARFPEEIAGETWGNGRVAIRFVGGPYIFSGLNAAQEEFIRKRYKDALSEESAAGVESRILKSESHEFLHFDQRGRALSFDFAHDARAVRMAGIDTMARLDLASGLRGALWTPLEEGAAFGGVFENYLRAILAYRLMECGGALIHSASAADLDGGAYLFVGQSGAGKTTLSLLNRAEGLTVLHDDLNVIYREESETMLTPVPFSGDPQLQGGERRAYPLRGIFRLSKSDRNGLEPLEYGETIAMLLACSPCVNHDAYRLDKHVSNLEALARSLPAHRLRFSLRGGFRQLIEQCTVPSA